jgi:hypothetical protein
MVAQLLADSAPGEIALTVVAVVASGLVPIMLLSWMLGSCVGPQCSPIRRAALAVGLAYLATIAIMAVWDPGAFGLFLAFLPLPGALGVFAWRLHLARKAGAESVARLP